MRPDVQEEVAILDRLADAQGCDNEIGGSTWTKVPSVIDPASFSLINSITLMPKLAISREIRTACNSQQHVHEHALPGVLSKPNSFSKASGDKLRRQAACADVILVSRP